MIKDDRNIMIDDDDDDNEIDVTVDTEEQYIKRVIKQGLEDAEKVSEAISNLIDMAEPLGNVEPLLESLIYYKEVLPNLLIGNYDYLLEGLDVLDQSEKNLAIATFKYTRKEIFENLVEKYN